MNRVSGSNRVRVLYKIYQQFNSSGFVVIAELLTMCLATDKSQCIIAAKASALAWFRHSLQYGADGMSGSIAGQNATACFPHTQHLQSDACIKNIVYQYPAGTRTRFAGTKIRSHNQ